PAVRERTYGLQIDRSRQTLADETRVRRFVYDDGIEELRRILIVFGAAVVARRDLLAAVQQRRGEIRCEAADADDLRATVETLRRQTRRARDGLGDAVVRQLADVFRGDGFHDRVRLAFVGDRILQRAAES